MLKDTDAAHVDYERIKTALEQVEVVADTVNASIKSREGFEKLVAIQAAFVGDIILAEAGRCHIKDGQLTKVCRKKNKRYHFFLFNDILVYADEIVYGLKAEGAQASPTALATPGQKNRKKKGMSLY